MDLTVGVKPYQDELEYMSLSRRAAMYLSDNFAWYDPNGRAALRKRGGEEDGDGADAPPRPSLDLAWQSFEHITLPRHLEGQMRGKGKQRHPRARVGERKKATRLYPVWKTHEVDLGDFGEGVSQPHSGSFVVLTSRRHTQGRGLGRQAGLSPSYFSL